MNRKLLKYLKPHWLFALLSPLFMLGEVLIDLSMPKLMSVIVDEGVLGVGSVSENMNVVLTTGLKMLILALIGGICGAAAAGFASSASQGFGNDVRSDGFRKVMSLSFEQTDKFTTGSLVTRLTNDITAVQNLVAMALRTFVRTPMNFLGGIFMTLTLDLKFSAIIFATLPLQIAIIYIVIKKSNPFFSLVQTKLDRVNSVVQENLLGSRMVKAYVREEYENRRFDEANADLAETTLRVQKLMAILSPILMILMNAVVIGIIYVGAIDIDSGSGLKVGSVMAATTYVTQILMSVMMMSMMFQSISRANASAARITEVLDSEPTIKDGKGAMSAGSLAVEFKNVTFTYKGLSGEPILSNISFDVKKGEKLAIIGATGSGKSSLVNLIPRFYDASEGEVFVDGVNVRDYKLYELRRKVGIVLQKTDLFSGTLADAIRSGQSASDEEVAAAAKIAQADSYITTFKDGYNTLIGEKGASLSGGQKQRLSIARAILRRPEILIFDDSTSALDLGTEARLTAALDEHLRGTTVIKIAQRVQSIKNFDRILVLDHGKVAAIGTHDELLETSELYKDICVSQEKTV